MSEIEGVALPYNGRRSTEWIDGLYWMSHALRQDARLPARAPDRPHAGSLY